MKPNIATHPDSGNPASDTADTWIDQLHSRPQSARQFGEWLADQLNEDVETYEVARTTDSIGLIKMTRNGVTFWVTVEVESEE